MQSCDHCGNPVSDKFVRVFGNQAGEVHACPNCSPNVGIVETARRRARQP